MEFDSSDKSLIAVAAFLRSGHSGVKVFEGIMADKRVDVFKGSTAVTALTSDSYQKHAKRAAPKINSPEQAQLVLRNLMDSGFFLRASRVGSSRHLQPEVTKSWSDDAYYAWVYRGSQLFTVLGGVGLLLLAFAGVMYPLWPYTLRIVVWYLMMTGVGFIIALFVLAIIRLIIYVVTFVTVKPGIWLFPNLFEDCGFFESFVPLWAWDRPTTKAEKKPPTGPAIESATDSKKDK